MRSIEITSSNQGQRVDKFLLKVLPGMSKSFCYKMFRKKNITLNGKKIQGNELLKSSDMLKIFFSEETYLKFSKVEEASVFSGDLPEVIYEDDVL